MRTFLSLASALALAAADDWVYEARANFTTYAMGYVTVINGHVMVDLDITNVSMYQGVSGTGVPEDCFDNGAYMHIHTEWNHETDYDYMGRSDCDSDETGDHFDPWFACSIDSDAEDCNYNGGCIRPSSGGSGGPAQMERPGFDTDDGQFVTGKTLAIYNKYQPLTQDNAGGTQTHRLRWLPICMSTIKMIECDADSAITIAECKCGDEGGCAGVQGIDFSSCPGLYTCGSFLSTYFCKNNCAQAQLMWSSRMYMRGSIGKASHHWRQLPHSRDSDSSDDSDSDSDSDIRSSVSSDPCDSFSGSSSSESGATTEPTTMPPLDPTNEPTLDPTAVPTTDPSAQPTADPTVDPTRVPSESSHCGADDRPVRCANVRSNDCATCIADGSADDRAQQCAHGSAVDYTKDWPSVPSSSTASSHAQIQGQRQRLVDQLWTFFSM